MGEAVEQARSRVRRFIRGFQVNQTSARYEPTDADKQRNVYRAGNKSVSRRIQDEVNYQYRSGGWRGVSVCGCAGVWGGGGGGGGGGGYVCV